MMKAFINARVYDYDTYIDKGFIVFDAQIQAVGPMTAFVDEGYNIYDVKGALVIPSFVIGHTHIYSTFARGLIMPFHPTNFQDILEQMWWKLDRELDNKNTFYSGIVNAVEMIKNGVTTVIDHHASGKDIKGSLEALKNSVCDTVGMRGIFAFEVSDRFDVEQSIKENVSFIERYQNQDVGALFGLHASMSLSEATLKRVKKELNDVPIHIHVAESEMDQDDAINKYSERVIERLDRHQLLAKDSIITHGLYLNDTEIAILKERECVVALNPSSNMNNGVGLPIYKTLKHANIPVILGNDGLSTGITHEYLTMLYAMRLKELDPNAFTLGDIKRIIQDTYKYVSRRFKVSLGNVKPGYQADLQVIPYIPATPVDASNILGHMFYGLFHQFKPKHVLKDGQFLVKDYQISHALTMLYKEAEPVAKMLWKRLKKEGKTDA
jgi:cytosine/adenosine deaminase-related metal-dependent hydrolase